jgi:hypothetical protein
VVEKKGLARHRAHLYGPLRHRVDAILPCLALALVLTLSPRAAGQSLALRVSTETSPPTGFVQIKVWAGAPQLVTGGGFAIDLDPPTSLGARAPR